MDKRTEQLERLLEKGPDSPTLRFGLGKAWLDEGDPARAAEHLQQAVALQADYSAAWKLLGKALAQAGRTEDARVAYARGIEVAEGRGDIQAAREMRVFARRLEKGEPPTR
ncbi:MAG: tetratricopeptide repeat protein [Thiohalomonadaceae bacterium]